MIRRAALCGFAAALLACSATVTVSTDPERNYATKFASMPEPRAEVVHSRVEREDVFPLGPRNGEWEFELVASPAWVEALLASRFEPLEWDEVPHRSGLPEWFAPDPERYAAWVVYGTSGIHSAHLFVERAPVDPQRVRLFVRRH